MNWNAASTGSLKSVVTRRNIWKPQAPAENKSKITCGSKESTEQQRRRSPPIHTRDRKELLSRGSKLQRHCELATQYGHQAYRVVSLAREHGQHRIQEPAIQAQRALTWARDHLFERSAVQDPRAILESALARGMGETTYTRIRHEFQRRIDTGEFQGGIARRLR